MDTNQHEYIVKTDLIKLIKKYLPAIVNFNYLINFENPSQEEIQQTTLIASSLAEYFIEEWNNNRDNLDVKVFFNLLEEIANLDELNTFYERSVAQNFFLEFFEHLGTAVLNKPEDFRGSYQKYIQPKTINFLEDFKKEGWYGQELWFKK